MHDWIGDVVAAIVALHVSAAVYASVKLGENLPWSMVTGRVRCVAQDPLSCGPAPAILRCSLMSEVRRVRPLLGCFVEIGVRQHGSATQSAVTQAFEAIALVEKLLGFQDPGSELSKLNRAGGAEFMVHRVTARVLRLAKPCAQDNRASAGV